jgi:hypothetical protein
LEPEHNVIHNQIIYLLRMTDNLLEIWVSELFMRHTTISLTTTVTNIKRNESCSLPITMTTAKHGRWGNAIYNDKTLIFHPVVESAALLFSYCSEMS